MAYKKPKVDVDALVKKASVATLRELLPPPNVDTMLGVTYTGYAPAGVAEDENGWQIFKTTSPSPSVRAISMPEGSDEFKFNWTDRASYTYSR
jgi:hypothetical protein